MNMRFVGRVAKTNPRNSVRIVNVSQKALMELGRVSHLYFINMGQKRLLNLD